MRKVPITFLLILFGLSAIAQNEFGGKLSKAAIELTKDAVVYDPSYFSIKYPMGDVPEGKGVCTDVVIRAYRKLGIDLQQLVHEDMKANFSSYPKIWGLKSTDKNIDHLTYKLILPEKEHQKRLLKKLPITCLEMWERGIWEEALPISV